MGELISFEQYLAILDQPALVESFSAALGTPYLCVTLTGYEASTCHTPLPTCTVVGITDSMDRLPANSPIDVCASELALDEVLANIAAQPLACTTLTQLLRHNETASITQGLFAESLSYSTLQQSRGFQHWLKHTIRPLAKTDQNPPVISAWDGNQLNITFNRPAAHNAYSQALRDELCAALGSAYAAAETTSVTLRGNGPSFCAGGDLAEFGQVTDAGEAHLSRTTRSAAALIAGLPCPTNVYVHGACIGAGIEVPSFADKIYAQPDSFFQLPEISMGLVPGAGGTVGMTQRIGRQRTAWMAITNRRIDAPTALAWGLVDEVEAVS